MKIKYLSLLLSVVIIDAVIINKIENNKERNIKYEEQLLLSQANAHFNDQVNTRLWNAKYGGIYAFPQAGQNPNPYLKNNSIRDDHNRTMIKINPAWMTRQLSELAKIDGYHFRITSLNPLNPNNKPNKFETKALQYMFDNNDTRYYAFNEATKEFQYMGALITKQACLACHQHQGYKVGDIRGGISVILDSSKHFANREHIIKTHFWQQVGVIIISVIVLFLLFKIMRHSEELEEKVKDRTQEINKSKLLLQAVLDAELNFLVVTDNQQIIYVNQTLLNFFGYDSQESFEKQQFDLGQHFEYTDEEPMFGDSQSGWVSKLLQRQKSSLPKVVLKRGRQIRFFRPYAKEIIVDDKQLYLVIFNEITEHEKEKKALETIASTDALTGLANRNKFDQIIEQQVELALTSSNPLSLIFLDLDNFKHVNDKFGHETGDDVLKVVAKLIKDSVRKGDLVARWGGEEIVVIMQSSEIDYAIKLAEKIRNKVADHRFKHGEVQTISCGVTQYREGEDADVFIHRADVALYEAKNKGRNRTEHKL